MSRAPQASRSNAPGLSVPISSKPLCSCKNCGNKKCPNILDMIPILSGKQPEVKRRMITTGLGKNSGKKKKRKPKVPPPRRPSLLDALDPDKDCGCEIMARALTSHLHVNMGLEFKREAINNDLDEPSLVPPPPEPEIKPTPPPDPQKKT